MDPSRWQRVKEIFEEAVAAEPGARSALLARSCGGDAELRAEVESLLAADGEEVAVLDESMFDTFDELLRRDVVQAGGRILGSYRLGEEIGRGGMAVVYAAQRDDEQYQRKVAVKLIKRGMETDLVVARFRQERQILAHLDHPSIARLYDGGVTDDGLPYLVMEYIEGEPIDTWCDRRGLDTAERLRLFRTVCEAVHYAHQKLVVHRDLKPSNILVTEGGEVKLLDFGIAKLVEPEAGALFDGADAGPTAAGPTAAGQRPMTPEYASPEQVRGEPITTASDIYSLGVLLYRLLTGHRPYRLLRSTPWEMERVICDQDPDRPSTAVGRDEVRIDADGTSTTLTPTMVSEVRDGTPARLRRVLRGDLDNIVLMALAKSPDERYGSVLELGEDLRRYQNGLPVRARKSTAAYRTAKFLRRHRVGMAAAALVFLSLVGGLVTTLWQARVAEAERVTSEQALAFLVDLFEVSHPGEDLGKTVTARELLDKGAEQIRKQLGDRPEVQARLLDTIGLAYFKLGLYDDAAPLLDEALELRRDVLGKGHPALATSLHNVGELCREQARYEDAERHHRRALELRREKFGDTHRLVAQSANTLAYDLFELGRLDEAEALLLETLEGERTSIAPEIAVTLENLALVLRAQSRLPEAEILVRKALAMNLELFTSEHPQVFLDRKLLADILRRKGVYETAREQYEEILELERGVLPENHPEIAKTLNDLAGCLKDLGRLDEAERYYEESLERTRASHGDEHPEVAGRLNNLAEVSYLRGEHEKAERLYRDALALYRKIHGDRHLMIAAVSNNLAATAQRMGRLDQAEKILRDVLELNRELLGEEHDNVARNLNNIAFLLAARGEHGEARELYRQALEINLRLFGEAPVEIAVNRRNLAESLVQLGEFEEAETLLRAALKRFREVRGDGHPDVAVALVWLSRALLGQGRPGEAEPLLRQALETWEKVGSRGGKAITESVLGRCLAELGRVGEGEPLLRSAHPTLAEIFGAAHPRTADAARWLVELDEARGRRRPQG